ncbi:3-hydroxyacyl-CoA dehydrogenase NAD-binding domain-containing protein [Pseudomonas stutzeri]|uniref:3-hydroxyacyl-CoA dehydrogenase NAD-binding domain-containing protein n=1 Tax=Stutzerimonas stutzeri TaxID=316 RepID=UPI00210CC0E4|nr:3-hydroxyacyl-CoA dehydrogenase NAD-binding domain-containing protein [Stutzerimonas stutzeri]MCQ4312814.1 3-hydroxyacyl-CoA dehydrogenase NAD-binding domain-containing protein [Stutzerimonas stutzeri]
MSDLIHYRLDDGLALIGLARAPVNALDQSMRAAISEACERAASDPHVQALVLYGEHGLFSAGADIHEFGTEAFFAGPDLPSILVRLAGIHKPMVAAIGKLALGGGLELALACGYRIGEPGTRLGLAEINLGLLPGAGGTQRLPRLIGIESALNLILSGEQVTAHTARLLGILDRIAPSAEQLLDEAKAYAYELIGCGAPARPPEAWPEPAEGLPDDFLARYRAVHEPRWKSRLAPRLVLSAMEAAYLLPLEEGLVQELALFKRAEASRQSKALRHVFFAEREAARIPGIGEDTALRRIDRVAIIGAGAMGGGIAMNFANAGIPVALLELDGAALDRGLAQIRQNYETSLKCGKRTAGQVQQRMELLFGTLDYADLANADLVIEAVFENMKVKQQVFRRLDEVCKPGAILASSTSSLDVDAIASVVSRPQDVIGLHFFSPANVMRVLEVVRARATAPDVLATTVAVARRIGKLPVISGVCFGFIGNRMLEPYAREAHRLVLEGATPAEVDAVLTGLDLNMGVFSMLDLAGLDVNFLIRSSNRAASAHDESYCRLGDELYAMGRHGQKSGRGFYLYQGRSRQEDEEVVALSAHLADELQVPRRRIDEQEIHDRCLFMLINEGIQLLDEGIALRASDIDLVWINGYGFPAHLGGPMHYAEHLGLDKILSGIQHYRSALGEYGEMWFRPAPLLERLVAAGHKRIERLSAQRADC